MVMALEWEDWLVYKWVPDVNIMVIASTEDEVQVWIVVKSMDTAGVSLFQDCSRAQIVEVPKTNLAVKTS